MRLLERVSQRLKAIGIEKDIGPVLAAVIECIDEDTDEKVRGMWKNHIQVKPDSEGGYIGTLNVSGTAIEKMMKEKMIEMELAKRKEMELEEEVREAEGTEGV